MFPEAQSLPSPLTLAALQQDPSPLSDLTVLHYACFYGRLELCHQAVHLTGALNCLFQRDRRHRSPVDLVPCLKAGKADVHLYTWGKTDDWQLGYLKDSQRTPRKVSFDHKPAPVVARAILCRHHSLFLTTSGELYSCGEGGKGRLGLGPTPSAFSPTQIPVPVRIEQISASDGHCLAVR